jgi:SAM-dependent methyltransferase
MIDFSITCIDINPYMLDRGRALAEKQGLISKFKFLQTDANNWRPNKLYHIIVANQSLHHIVELELLFEKIRNSLHKDGYFLVHDMIGRNGHMRWPEALEIVLALWSLLDEKHKYNWQLKRYEPIYQNWDCSKVSFEGIRSQDILPSLIKYFNFEMFFGFNNLIDIFVDRCFGHNFNEDDIKDRYFIDFVAGLDDYFIGSGKIKPTQMLGALKVSQVNGLKIYKNLTPEFCVRFP